MTEADRSPDGRGMMAARRVPDRTHPHMCRSATHQLSAVTDSYRWGRGRDGRRSLLISGRRRKNEQKETPH